MNSTTDWATAERRDFADLLDSLNDEQWNAPSLCGDWRVRDVAIHIVAYLDRSTPGFFTAMARHRGRVDGLNAADLSHLSAWSHDDIVAALRAHVVQWLTAFSLGYADDEGAAPPIDGIEVSADTAPDQVYEAAGRLVAVGVVDNLAKGTGGGAAVDPQAAAELHAAATVQTVLLNNVLAARAADAANGFPQTPQ